MKSKLFRNYIKVEFVTKNEFIIEFTSGMRSKVKAEMAQVAADFFTGKLEGSKIKKTKLEKK
jgi:hypothetical protein